MNNVFYGLFYLAIYSFSFVFIGCNSEDKSTKNADLIDESQLTIEETFLGIYNGVQPSYTMKNQYGDDIIIGGQKIIVPDIEYKFLLKKDGISSLQQTNLEDNSRVYYEGKSEILSENDNTLTIECSLKTADGKSNPTYKLIIIKSDQSAICMGTNEPKFNLEKSVMGSKKNKNSNDESSQFTILNQTKYDISKLTFEGKIVHNKFWKDSSGENIVLFTKNEKNIYVYHYVINGNNTQLLRKVYDFEKECDYDLFLGFVSNSITITDLDKNDIGEITFAYKKGCISDVSPLTLKLLILEDGNKYIIRGKTSIHTGNEKIGGDKNIDPSFEKAPQIFKDHANSVWDKI